MTNYTHYKCDGCGLVKSAVGFPRTLVYVTSTNHCEGTREVYPTQYCPDCMAEITYVPDVPFTTA